MRYAPVQRVLTADEVDAVLTNYKRRHPLRARILYFMLGYRRNGSTL